MKYIVCLVLVWASTSRASHEEMHRYKEECVKELNLDTSKYPDPTHPPGGFKPEDFNPETVDHDQKCLFRCIMQKEGVLNSADELQVDVAKEKIPTRIVNSVDFDKCTPVKEDDPCEASFEVNRCIMDQVFNQVKKLNSGN